MTEWSEIVDVEHSNLIRKGKGQEQKLPQRRENSLLLSVDGGLHCSSACILTAKFIVML